MSSLPDFYVFGEKKIYNAATLIYWLKQTIKWTLKLCPIFISGYNSGIEPVVNKFNSNTIVEDGRHFHLSGMIRGANINCEIYINVKLAADRPLFKHRTRNWNQLFCFSRKARGRRMRPNQTRLKYFGSWRKVGFINIGQWIFAF